MAWGIALPILAGAGLGALSGAAKARESRRQRARDIRANAIEARYSWLLDPNYREVTRPISTQGAVLGGVMSGGLQGALIASAFDGAGKAAPTTGTEAAGGELLLNPAAKATQLQASNLPEAYTSKMGIPSLTEGTVPQTAWTSQLSPGLTTQELGQAIQTQPIPGSWLYPEPYIPPRQPPMPTPGMTSSRVPSYWGAF